MSAARPAVDIRTSPICEDIDVINNADKISNKAKKNAYFKRKRNVVYSSPLWRRDSTNRLQRKPIRKSTSDSAIDEIGRSEYESEDYTNFNTNRFNNSTPCCQRVEFGCFKQTGKGKMPEKNHQMLSSTMNNGCSGTVESENNPNPYTFKKRGEELAEVNNGRNHTGKLKISNSWIDWTPFWSRDHESKRLDRRHYISDFY